MISLVLLHYDTVKRSQLLVLIPRRPELTHFHKIWNGDMEAFSLISLYLVSQIMLEWPAVMPEL